MKVVLHAHSTWSYDGHWSLEKIARTFGRMGVRAVMMTEHDTGFDPARFAEYRGACVAASTPRCRLIPGIEYSCPDNDVHILTWGLNDFLAEHRPVMETLTQVQERGGVAILAHPIRRDAWRLFDPAWVPFLSAIEIWNRKSDGVSWGPRAQALLDQTGLPASVGMDFHRPRHIYPLINRINVAAGDDLEAALVAALRAGQQVPTALGLRLLGRDGRARRFPHTGLEALRQATRPKRRHTRKSRQ